MKSTKNQIETKAKGPVRGSFEHLAAEALAGRSVFVRWYAHVPGLATREENREHGLRISREWRERGFKVRCVQGGMGPALRRVRPGLALIVVGGPAASAPHPVRVVSMNRGQMFAG